MTREQKRAMLKEYASDRAYFDRIWHQLQLARVGLAKVPTIYKYFPGIGKVMSGQEPLPSVDAREYGRLRRKGVAEGRFVRKRRLKHRLVFRDSVCSD